MFDELDEPEIIDFVGVVIGRNEDGLYDVYRVLIAGGELSLLEIKSGFGRDRSKKAAMRVAQTDLIDISQQITKKRIDFGDNDMFD